jgi:DNA-binding LytR/AlgR family response regulator
MIQKQGAGITLGHGRRYRLSLTICVPYAIFSLTLEIFFCMLCVKFVAFCAIFATKRRVAPLLKIAVCDDHKEDLQKIQILLEEYLQSHLGLTAKVETFLGGSDLLAHIEEYGSFDCYILDILMPEQNGIAVGKRLRSMGDKGEVIFLTSSNDYAADSYDVRAFFYLLKPVEKEKLFHVLDDAVKKLTQREEKAFILETRDGPRRILLENVLYAEREGRVMRCHCTDGIVDSQTLRGTFHDAAAPLLADPRFYLCGASFVLNFQHISGVNGQEALLDNGQTVILPRRAAMEFKRAWGNYWLEEMSK